MPYYDFRLEVKLHQAAAIIADDVFVNALINSKCSHTNGNIAQPLCNKLQFKEGIHIAVLEESRAVALFLWLTPGNTS